METHGGIVALTGAMMLFSPAIVCLIERGGDTSLGSYLHWRARQPLDRLLTLAGLQTAGVAFVTAGLAQMAWSG